MVVLGSAAMAIFGLGPVFDTLASGGGRESGRAAEVIATWKGGEITRVDLDLMEQRHFQAQRFLGELRKQAEKKKGDPVNSLALPIAMVQDGKREMIDDQLITRFLMAERAKEEGMVVSDGMVNDYLAMFSGDVGFSKNDLEEINTVANNRYCSLQAVRERLKIELMANQMQICARAAIPFVPNPVEAMELYGRTMEQIECEVLPIEVEKYVSKVEGQPSAADIKKLYEEGKFQFSDPTGERPGFKIGRKLNLQYVVADYQTYLQNEMNKLSDEDVQKEYDRLVEEKNDLVMEAIPVDDTIQIEPPPSDGNSDGEVSPPPMETEESSDENKPADVDAPPAESNSEASADEGNADEGNTDEGSSESEEAKKEEGENEGDQSLNIRSSKFQFVSTAAPQDEGAQDEAPATKKPDPADESATQAEDQEKTDEPKMVEPGGLDQILEDAAAGQVEEEDKRTPKPLKDVVEQVKESMCESAALKAMETNLTKAEVRVADYFQKRLTWEFDESRKKGDPPTPIDYKAVAKQYNLIAKETGLVDDVEIAADTIGQVRVFMQTMSQGRQVPQLVPVGALVFNEFNDLKLYDSQTINDNWGTKNGYLFWASEKADTRIPTLEEAEADIIKFWKSQRALELAMAEGELIKKKVNDVRSKKMSEMYSDRAFSTGAFTWFSNFGSTRYGSPTGVTMAGNEFMKTAFSLAELEAGVATNETKDTVYVIQSQSELKSPEEVGSDYLENHFFKYKRIPNEVLRVSQLYFQELNLNWNQEFQDTMELKFLDR
jgi:hypothetical protein